MHFSDTLVRIVFLFLLNLYTSGLPRCQVTCHYSVDADEDKKRNALRQEDADRNGSDEPKDGQPAVDLAEGGRVLHRRP